MQNSASVVVPLTHEALRHCVLEPGKAQDWTLMPSHDPPQAVPSLGHGGREPTGAPLMGEQTPSWPGTLQA